MSLTDNQRRLTALGYYNGRADGIYGVGTDAAIAKVIEIAERVIGVVPAKTPEVVAKVPGNYPLPKGFDSNYLWLGNTGTLPRLLQEMIDVYGVQEVPGAGNNPVILGWARETGLEKTYTADSIAWCGLVMAVVCKRAGYDVPAGPLWALNWLNFGVKADVPSLGDILCFERFDGSGKRIGGHVGEYIGEDSEYYHVLGGNTDDRVMIARLLKTRLRAARRPAYKNPLPSWKPYQVAANGLISRNEA